MFLLLFYYGISKLWRSNEERKPEVPHKLIFLHAYTNTSEKTLVIACFLCASISLELPIKQFIRRVGLQASNYGVI